MIKLKAEEVNEDSKHVTCIWLKRSHLLDALNWFCFSIVSKVVETKTVRRLLCLHSYNFSLSENTNNNRSRK